MRRENVEVGAEYGEEYQGTYVFQEITWAKRSRIIQKHTKYHPLTGQVLSSDFIAIQAETIWAALKQQPQSQPLTLEKLLGEENGIPIALGELFSQVVNGLCAVTRDEAAFYPRLRRQKPNPVITDFRSARSSGGPLTNSPNSPPESSSNSPSSSTN